MGDQVDVGVVFQRTEVILGKAVPVCRRLFDRIIGTGVAQSRVVGRSGAGACRRGGRDSDRLPRFSKKRGQYRIRQEERARDEVVEVAQATVVSVNQLVRALVSYVGNFEHRPSRQRLGDGDVPIHHGRSFVVSLRECRDGTPVARRSDKRTQGSCRGRRVETRLIDLRVSTGSRRRIVGTRWRGLSGKLALRGGDWATYVADGPLIVEPGYASTKHGFARSEDVVSQAYAWFIVEQGRLKSGERDVAVD